MTRTSSRLASILAVGLSAGLTFVAVGFDRAYADDGDAPIAQQTGSGSGSSGGMRGSGMGSGMRGSGMGSGMRGSGNGSGLRGPNGGGGGSNRTPTPTQPTGPGGTPNTPGGTPGAPGGSPGAPSAPGAPTPGH